MPLSTGDKLGPYEIVAPIGAGGMGEVYKARDTRLDRIVAVKVLPERIAQRDDLRARFEHEARVVASLNHPHICVLYDIGNQDGVGGFMVMEFLEGETLKACLEGGSLPLDRALLYATQISDGLDRAHRAGVTHRDIKPGNIIITRDGVKVLDFGLAKSTPELGPEDATAVAALTKEGTILGTPDYMSPEQIQGGAIDGRSDVWSLGVVLYEMLTCKLPFRYSTAFGTVHGILHDEVAPPSSLRPETPPELDTLVLRALAKNPAARWTSAGEMASALRGIQGTQAPTRTMAVPAPSEWPRPSAIRSAHKPAAYAAALVLLFAIITWFAVKQPWRGGLPEEKQIAVLPLEVRGADENTRLIADGLVDVLTSKLTQAEQFQGKVMVIPASEIRGRKISSAEQANRIYGANLVVTGSAQRWGDRIQFTLNLVDARKMRQIGARTFEFDASNPIALRDAAVNGVVRLLEVRLSDVAGPAGADYPQASEAYAAYLRGRGYLARYDVPGNPDRAIESFGEAIRRDPDYALAWALHGEAFWRKGRATHDPELYKQALASVRRAIQLDAGLAEAHVRYGAILAELGRSDEAVREARRALQLAPGNAEAYRVLANVYEATGKPREAESALAEAVRQRPRDWLPHVSQGLFYMRAGRMAEARRAFEAARTLTPDNDIVLANLAGLSLREGKFRETSDLLERQVRVNPTSGAYSQLGLALYYQRRFQEAAAALETSVSIEGKVAYRWGNLGTAYRFIPGARDKAEAAFRKAIEMSEAALRVAPGDHEIQADLAEYRAKIGDREGAVRAADAVPEASRQMVADRLVLAWELSGNRRRAVELIRSLPQGHSTRTYMRSDPELGSLWVDPALR